MTRHRLSFILYLLSLIPLSGCFNIKAPEKFEVTAPEIRVGSAASDTPPNVPDTKTHEEARAELRKAYARIDDLVADNRKLHAKIDKLEATIDKLEKERKEERKAAKRDRSKREYSAPDSEHRPGDYP